MPKFRKKPVVIEAVRVADLHHAAGNDWKALPTWVVDAYEGRNEAGVRGLVFANHPRRIEVLTLEGTMTADEGDWLIRGVKGEIYPCKADIFAASYEPA